MEFADMARLTPFGRLGLLAVGALIGSLLLSAAALADGSCADDLKKLTDRRVVELNDINALAAAGKKKPIDPTIFCAKSHALNAAEDALIAYMEKNKDWCSVPDEIIANLKQTHAKSLEFGGKACVAAAKFKKMKEQQANGGGNGAPQAQPLPAGPL
jgi:hypothetical protein